MIIVFAKAVAKEGKKEKVLDIAENLIKNTRLEEGNIDYNLFENVENGAFQFIEQWKDIESLQEHLKADHFVKFGEESADCFVDDLAITVFESEETSL